MHQNIAVIYSVFSWVPTYIKKLFCSFDSWSNHDERGNQMN